jgi:transposase
MEVAVSGTTTVEAQINADDQARCKKQGRERGHRMDKEQDHVAKMQFIASMQKGHSWQTATVQAGLHISQSTAYRLWAAWRKLGEGALSDGRHGHPIKLRGTARTFLENYCQQTPSTPSSVLKTLLEQRFGVRVSVSQINRVRAALGISNRSQSQFQEKKRQGRELFLSTRVAGRSRQSPVARRCSPNRVTFSPSNNPFAKPPHC